MGHVDTHLAELSRTIDQGELGRRIRNARIAAGMTQAQVAGEDVGAAYLSRIEDGKRRPEAKLLERMAHRMDTTLEQLLLGAAKTDVQQELQLEIDYAELALAAGEIENALSKIEGVLAQCDPTHSPGQHRAALQLKASALEATGAINEAIILLEDLTAAPQPDAGWLKALIALSRCYRETGEFARAISVGERAAASIEELGLAGVTEAIQLTVTVAGAYMQNGDTDQAMRICQRAIEAADEARSPIAKASAYWNASLIEARKGATASALALAQKAVVLFELGDDSRNLGRLRTQVAFMQLQLDPPDPAAAQETLVQAERELAWSAASSIDKADHHLAMARALFMLGDRTSALAQIELGHDLAGDQAPLLSAEIHVVRGQIAAAGGDLEDARAAYRNAIHTLTGVGADRDAAQMWFELGNLLDEVGDHEEARNAYRSAAASTGLLTRKPLGERVEA